MHIEKLHSTAPNLSSFGLRIDPETNSVNARCSAANAVVASDD
jgi:hypothetical protein